MKTKYNVTFLIIITYILFVLTFGFFLIDFLVADIYNILLLIGFVQGVFFSIFAVFLINKYKLLKKYIKILKR